MQVFPSGEKYEGQWGDGLRNGEGTLWVPTGSARRLRKLYVGGWKDDKRHGRGTCFFKDGEFFQGSWDQGKMHGQGTLRYGNGDLYIGEWHDGQRSGQGTLNKANGDCYEGFWLADKREGTGSYFYAASGKVFVGEWANDLPRAGVYTQAKPNPEQAAIVPTTSVLPPVRLALPLDVIEGALAGARNERRAFRVRTAPVERLFTEDELVALREAFEAARQEDGHIGLAQLQGLCGQLGAEVSVPRLHELVADAGATTPKDPDGPVLLRLEDFLRIAALLFDEEAHASPGGSQGDAHFEMGTEFWGEGGGMGADMPYD